jgi:hypothetical protein
MLTLHKLPEGFIVTSDEKIKKGDIIIEYGKPIVKCKTILDSNDLV